MSHPVGTRGNRRSEPPAEETVHSEGEITELLEVLDDEDCRAVLEATGTEPLSTKEIAERCEMPSSTAYRKIDCLVEAGLLSESIRISGSGKHASEYSRSVDRIALSIGDGSSELQVERGVTEQVQPAD